MSLRKFAGNLIWLQGLICGLPFISKLVDVKTSLPFPPMGDDPFTWRFFALIFAFIAAFLPNFFLPAKRRGLSLFVLVIFLVISAGLYLYFDESYIITIPVPDGKFHMVTRGSVRNPELREPYASMNDIDAIKSAGQFDSDLEKVYTKESLQTNRARLYICYVSFLVFLELILGSFVKSQGTIAAEPSAVS